VRPHRSENPMGENRVERTGTGPEKLPYSVGSERKGLQKNKQPTNQPTTKLNPSEPLNPLVCTLRLTRSNSKNFLVHPLRHARCIRDAALGNRFYSSTRWSLTCFGYLRWNSFTKVTTASSPSICSQGSHDASTGGYPFQNTKYSTRFALRLSRLFAIDSTTQNLSPSMTSGGGGSCLRTGI
jgi:hypothetical protein